MFSRLLSKTEAGRGVAYKRGFKRWVRQDMFLRKGVDIGLSRMTDQAARSHGARNSMPDGIETRAISRRYDGTKYAYRCFACEKERPRGTQPLARDGSKAYSYPENICKSLTKSLIFHITRTADILHTNWRVHFSLQVWGYPRLV